MSLSSPAPGSDTPRSTSPVVCTVSSHRLPNTTESRPTVLVVDDDPANLQVLRLILQAQYRLLFARDGQKALELARQEQPQLVLLDVMMPGMTGHETCRRLKAHPQTAHIPVIFVTTLDEIEDEMAGFDAGAVDYITKPVSPPIVQARVRTHLSLVSAQSLLETRLQIIERLGRAAEYKDNETGLHVIRMSRYAQVLALAAGWPQAAADDLLHAAPMHDIGKIGIPDHVLQKPGPLTADEWVTMKRHPEIGAAIIGEHASPMIQMARRIALCHHEKWNGAGYPAGLQGTDIPVEARIVAIADVFDALTTVRPYKKAWTVDAAVAQLVHDAGSHFDPVLVPLFVENLPEILQVCEQFQDP